MLTLPRGWSVSGSVDKDGHLNILVKNTEGSDIVELESCQADGTDGDALSFRMTTEKIEDCQ